MESELTILDRLYQIPNGYLNEKSIGGRVYAYWQEVTDGRLHSRYLKGEEAAFYRRLYKERKKLIKALKRLLFLYGLPLSCSSTALDGEVMLFDEPVASFKAGNCVFLDYRRAPALLSRGVPLEQWLLSRLLDLTRANSPKLLKELKVTDALNAVLSVNARSLTDFFWFKPLKSKKRYVSAKKLSDIYGDLALKGQPLPCRLAPVQSPEVTTRGAQEKGWRKEKDGWWLYKSESSLEAYSEIVSSRISQALGIKTAEYRYAAPYVKTKLFIDKHGLEPFAAYLGDDDSFEAGFRFCLSLGKRIAKQYLSLLYFDSLVSNFDRHNENLAVLRDPQDGHIVSLAPNYDFNMTLLGNDLFPRDETPDGFTKRLFAFLDANPLAKALFCSIEFPILSAETLASLIHVEGITSDEQWVLSYLLAGQRHLLAYRAASL